MINVCAQWVVYIQFTTFNSNEHCPAKDIFGILTNAPYQLRDKTVDDRRSKYFVNSREFPTKVSTIDARHRSNGISLSPVRGHPDRITYPSPVSKEMPTTTVVTRNG